MRDRPPWIVTLDDATCVVGAMRRLASMLTRSPTKTRATDDGRIGELFRERRGDVMGVAAGRVVRVLPDDRVTADGTGKHQRFLIESPGRQTVKLSHHFAFGRMPARVGARVAFRGEYVYNALGGAVYWTHRDPKRWHEDGSIDVDGRRYG